MRDQQMTGYGPKPVVGVTPEQRATVQSRRIACDGEAASGLGHPRIWLHIEGHDVTCPYCSITYVLAGNVEHADSLGNRHAGRR